MNRQNADVLAYMNDGSIPAPFFEKVTLASNQDDGYWVQAVDVNGDGRLDIVTSGLAVGKVVWYENPTWAKHVIADFPLPVAMDAGDIAGRGRNDLVITHNYGNCMFWCRPEDGKISWLENPGTFADDKPWPVHFIADLMAAHRVQLGHFSQTEQLELLAMPVVGCRPFGKGVHEPVAVTLFERPRDVLNAPRWKSQIIDDQHFRIIHDVVRDQFGEDSGSRLESVMLASEEGVSWYYYDSQTRQWQIVPIGPGDNSNVANGFKGCGNLAYRPGRRRSLRLHCDDRPVSRQHRHCLHAQARKSADRSSVDTNGARYLRPLRREVARAGSSRRGRRLRRGRRR